MWVRWRQQSRDKTLFFDEMLPAKAVAVLLQYGKGKPEGKVTLV
jgi:hypothetical protein